MYRILLIAALVLTLLPQDGRSAQTAPQRAADRFYVDESVTAADEYLIRESTRFAQDYFFATFGTNVSRRIIVNVKNDPNESMNYARDLQIHVNSSTFLGFPLLIRTEIMVHEYFHLWQEDASGRHFATPSQVHPLGPQWLIEGSAEYIGQQSLISTGIVSPEEIRERTIQMARGAHNNGHQALPLLQDLQVATDMVGDGIGCCAYWLSTIAVESLVGSGGPRLLGEYFQALDETDDPWETVFEEKFGISANDFYVAFEAERASLLVPSGLDVTQLLRTPSYNEVPADLGISLAPESIEPGKQVWFYGWSGNGSTCDMNVGSVASDDFATYSTFGDAYGLVVWFWSAPETLEAESLTFNFDCGAAPVTIEIAVD